MKKYFIVVLVLLFSGSILQAQEDVLRSRESVEVKNGKIVRTGVLADNDGVLFVEFIAGDFVVKRADTERCLKLTRKDFQRRSCINTLALEEYEGEVLAPVILDKPDKAPRARMREIITFEMIVDTNDEVFFVDRYTIMHPSERLRQGIRFGDLEPGNSGAQVLMRIFNEDEIGQPSLWFYNTDENRWREIGGILTDSAEPDVKIFSAIIARTGLYTIWDANPPPTFSPNFPIDEIELAEESPFPSVEIPTQEGNFIEEDIDGSTIPGVDEFKSSANTPPETETEELGTFGERTNNHLELPDFVKENFLNPDGTPVGSEQEIVVPSLDGGASTTPETGTDQPVNPNQITPNTFTPPNTEETGNNPNIPVITTENTPQNTGESNTNALPSGNLIESQISDSLQSAAPLLQANSFSNFGETLPVTGRKEDFKFPWLIVVVLALIGGSLMIAFQKKY